MAFIDYINDFFNVQEYFMSATSLGSGQWQVNFSDNQSALFDVSNFSAVVKPTEKLIPETLRVGRHLGSDPQDYDYKFRDFWISVLSFVLVSVFEDFGGVGYSLDSNNIGVDIGTDYYANGSDRLMISITYSGSNYHNLKFCQSAELYCGSDPFYEFKNWNTPVSSVIPDYSPPPDKDEILQVNDDFSPSAHNLVSAIAQAMSGDFGNSAISFAELLTGAHFDRMPMTAKIMLAQYQQSNYYFQKFLNVLIHFEDSLIAAIKSFQNTLQGKDFSANIDTQGVQDKLQAIEDQLHYTTTGGEDLNVAKLIVQLLNTLNIWTNG
jgi:hypothetical protein